MTILFRKGVLQGIRMGALFKGEDGISLMIDRDGDKHG